MDKMFMCGKIQMKFVKADFSSTWLLERFQKNGSGCCISFVLCGIHRFFGIFSYPETALLFHQKIHFGEILELRVLIPVSPGFYIVKSSILT